MKKSFPQGTLKCSSANVGTGGTHGAERSDQNSITGSRRSSEASGDGNGQSGGADRSTGLKTRLSLSLKLRQQAAKLGLKPGSDRWKAYVLGTEARMQKAQQRRPKKQRAEASKVADYRRETFRAV